MDTDDLTRDQKVDFVLEVHELGRLAEEWARSTIPLTDKELNRFQALCADLGVSESSLLTRYQRRAREDAFDRTFGQPLLDPPKSFENLPKRQPQPVSPPMTAHERWVQEQAGRDQAYSDPKTGVISKPEELRQSVPNAVIVEASGQIQTKSKDESPEYQLPHTDAEAAKILSAGRQKPAVTNRPPSPTATPSSKSRRKPGAEFARVVSAVPSDPHGKITMAPPESPNEQTTAIPTVKDEEGK